MERSIGGKEMKQQRDRGEPEKDRRNGEENGYQCWR